MGSARIRIGDVTVKSWAELMDALYDIPQSRHQRFRSDFVYRGLADRTWGLKTSLVRLGAEFEKVERPLLRSFSKYAQPGSIPSDSLLVKLAVAQHYGLPTRVLDWTVSPKVALHFATCEQEHYDKDGVIWCVDVAKARALLPPRLREILEREDAFLFSVEMLQEMNTLDDLAKHGRDGELVLFFEPPSLDGRIVNQGAILSITTRASTVLSDFLRAHPMLFHRIIIPRKLKWEVRDKLDQDNVTERMLFPGLAGLSTWLKRYYGPGPGGVAPPGQ